MLTPTRFSLAALFAFSFASLTGCASATEGDAVDDSTAAMTSHSDRVEDFECTSVASSATDARLKSTRLDVTIDIASTGKPSGNLVTGFEPSLHATAGVGFGVSHVRDTTVGGQQVSEYKIDFGADSILPGATGGTLTIPTVYTHLSLAGSAALDVATLRFTPSNATATYKCKKDTRRPDPGPVTDPGPTYQGSAKTVVANDPCAKKVAEAVMDKVIEGLEDEGVDIPDDFTFTKIDRTASGYATVVNESKVPVVVAAGCKIVSMDVSAATGSNGE
jgi:hypothetical protein